MGAASSGRSDDLTPDSATSGGLIRIESLRKASGDASRSSGHDYPKGHWTVGLHRRMWLARFEVGWFDWVEGDGERETEEGESPAGEAERSESASALAVRLLADYVCSTFLLRSPIDCWLSRPHQPHSAADVTGIHSQTTREAPARSKPERPREENRDKVGSRRSTGVRRVQVCSAVESAVSATRQLLVRWAEQRPTAAGSVQRCRQRGDECRMAARTSRTSLAHTLEEASTREFRPRLVFNSERRSELRLAQRGGEEI